MGSEHKEHAGENSYNGTGTVVNTLNRIPLTIKMVMVTVVIGLCLWAVMEYIQSARLKKIFYVQLFVRLSEQSMEWRISLDRYIRFHHETAEIIVSQKAFSDYVNKQQWTAPPGEIKYYTQPPPWLLRPSVLRTLVRPRYALLLDAEGKVREVYSRYSGTLDIPELLDPSPLLISKTREQSFVTKIDKMHYIITSELAQDRKSAVMLASPLDEEFLVSAIGILQPGYLIALVDQEKDPTVVISSNHAILPPGTHIHDLGNRFLVTGQNTYNYGAAEYMINLVSLISREEADKLTDSVLSTGRYQRNIIAPAFILTFAVLLMVITRRISRLNRRMSEFSQQTLGAKTGELPKGDELYLLEKRFERLTEEVAEAREIIKKQAEERTLKESHERLLIVLDSLEAIVYVADMNTHELLFANKYTRNLWGDIEGKICWQFLQTGQQGPCKFCTNDKLLTPAGEPAGVYRWEFQNTTNGNWYYIIDRAIKWIDGRVVRLEIATDITERKRAENRIRDSLREKEILLKEIHHRVKNNMQVISSLLNIQFGKLKDRPEADLFNESRNRISAMALVHEKLYRSESLSKIDFADYIKSLTNSLFTFYDKSTRNISVRVNADRIFLGIDSAIPCGLIINELVSNSMKYAFPNDRSGEISISLSNAVPESGWDYELAVNDNGIGIPSSTDIRKTVSLGLQLVTNLAEHQLQGKVELFRNGGTEFRIYFKEPKYKSRL
ncbi:MAG: histidine kinase dimerization/phosphoacceptor domain -containing protein [Nitrospirota bacterium]